jgi:hypothetical protein
MSGELARQPDYSPVRRNGCTVPSPVRRIMALRSEALIDRARIAAEVANEEFQVHERMTAGFNLAEHLAARAERLRSIIGQSGNDPELHQLHSYIKGASTEAIINLIRGDDGR